MPPTSRPIRPDPRRAPPWRRVSMALAAAFLAAVVWLWWPAAEPALPALDPARDVVVFLGDSITGGHGLPLEATFPSRLGAALGIRVRNAGISGDTTAGALGRLETDVLGQRPALVVVELGANDAFRRVPPEEMGRNLRAIVRRLHESGSGVLLLHVRVPVFAEDAYRRAFRTIAREESVRLVEDFLDGVVPGLTTDGLHPTAEGHARLAARLEPVLRPLLVR